MQKCNFGHSLQYKIFYLTFTAFQVDNQKLHIILEKEVFQKLKLSKKTELIFEQ